MISLPVHAVVLTVLSLKHLQGIQNPYKECRIPTRNAESLQGITESLQGMQNPYKECRIPTRNAESLQGMQNPYKVLQNTY